jgi:hypothetical protein
VETQVDQVPVMIGPGTVAIGPAELSAHPEPHSEGTLSAPGHRSTSATPGAPFDSTGPSIVIPFRDDVHNPADGVGAVQGRGGSTKNLHPIDLIEGNGQVHVEMPGLGIAHSNAVHENHHLFEARSPNADVALRRGAGLNLHPGGPAQEAGKGPYGKRFNLAAVEKDD